MTHCNHIDTLVVGGGVVGLSVAYGLARRGEAVRVLDGSDDAFRASRGNFGLVWVQGKGQGNPPYARWTIAAAQLWPQLAQELAEETGIDVELSQVGGLSMCLDEKDLADRAAGMESLRAALDGRYRYEMLDLQGVRELVPETGPEVVGAVFCPLDGHVSPLRLVRALLQAFTARGGQLVCGVQVDRIEHRPGEFRVMVNGTEYVAGRVVLAAGLGNRALATQVGLQAPVVPVRGQILVTERMRPFLRHPTLYVRQTGEGVLQLGDSKEEVGFDDGTSLEQLARIARRAARCIPLIAQANVVRTWGALRVMSPDGYPIYQQSGQCPGAFVVTCHSGVTLAAMHAGPVADWIRGGPEPTEMHRFKAERFDV